jgi:uncharacterized protein with HEPN domain
MTAPKNDSHYIWDMLEAAKLVRDSALRHTYDQFISNDILYEATEHRLQRIGEAARRVSAELRRAHPDVPWSDIIGQRNIIVHDYGEVEAREIWRSVLAIPVLIARLEPILKELEPGGPP